ncbi:MAG TPA: outer membrane protein assembly factor BamA [Bacteroidia bacterium]|jgi:outer membrane protein insertion porin family|nr:outer membrane protein assembly factor BamA [Bacteroidia bacterium]
MKKYILSIFLFLGGIALHSQTQVGSDFQVDYNNVREYTLVNVYVHGCHIVDSNVVRLISGLPIGDKITIPGDKTGDAISNVWKEGMFDDVQLQVFKVDGDYIWLDLVVTEKPMIMKYKFVNVKKSEDEDLRNELHIGHTLLTDFRAQFIKNTVNEHFQADGYRNCTTTLDTVYTDATKQTLTLNIVVHKGKKVKIADIFIDGNVKYSDGKIRRMMKDTKRKRIYQVFKSSKFIDENYDKDKLAIIAKYHKKGYRDARITWDTTYNVSTNRMVVKMTIDEGGIYYFGNITWNGNTKYSSDKLGQVLGIKAGDVYNEDALETRLYMNPQGNDVSSLYMDDGYLFFQVNPVETNVHGDSIDYEMRIYEGKQATIRKVYVTGNTKTNDRVVMREIKTKPGQLFRRSDLIRSQRELASLGYFDPERIQINPKPDPYTGTVDIEYVVVEKPSDQVELSGGWGAGRVVGTLGVSFNNFSTKNFWDASQWRPLPSGDGQKLSIRAQSNGYWFQSYNASFTEPWLGGKKPNSLSFTFYHSVQSNGLKFSDPNRTYVKISGVSVGYGIRLKRPDDYFTLYFEGNYQYYDLHNFYSVFAFSDGYSNNINGRVMLSRNSTDQIIYPRNGSNIKLSFEGTIPYSLMTGKDYSTLTQQQLYKYVEYFKWKFTSSWFTRIVGNLVLNTRIGFGYLGMYNSARGLSPFERFYLGGSGLTGFALDGREIIALRGYNDQSLTSQKTGAPIIAKYTFELRYPVSLNPSATVFGLAFAEAGNTWSTFKGFNPFDVYRSAGVGVRVYLPMFGLLGLDWGYRFDNVPLEPNMQRSQVHFTIGMDLGEL